MKFGLFYEQELPKPWGADAELRLFQETLEQVELADQLGWDYVWQVEHHFLEEYAHSSAPESLLAAMSQRTKRIRLGHGVMLMVPHYNHPARCAERIATLDLLSNGRAEWGTGESSSALELQAFGVPIEDKRPMWREATEQAARMLSLTPYPGYSGKYFSMPCRNIVPKSKQKPHPPLWLACNTLEMVETAARLGMGALTFIFAGPEEAKPLVDRYYEVFKTECVPISEAVNPNICIMSPLAIHVDREEAIKRSAEGFAFFGRTLRHYYIQGEHKPGFTDLWSAFQSERVPGKLEATGGVGNPDDVRQHIAALEATGVDQVGFVLQAGRAKHAHILEEMNLFASGVMGEFKARDKEREARKAEELAPYIRAALARREHEKPLSAEDVVVVKTLSEQAAEAAAKGGQIPRWARERLASARQTQSQIDNVLKG